MSFEDADGVRRHMDISHLARIQNDLSERIKLYEQRTDDFPPVEVLNEIRYGFRAALELLEHRDQPDADRTHQANLMERIKHALLCAYHDLVDGAVIETIRAVDNLIRDYPASYIVVSDRLAEIYDVATEVEEKIVESRGKPKDRMTIYDEDIYGKWFDDLAEGLAFIKRTAVRQIVQHDVQRRQRQRRHVFWTAVSLTVGLIGAILTAVSMLV